MRQLDAHGRALLGAAWDETLARFEQAVKQDLLLRQSAGQFRFLLHALLQAQAEPLVVYLDNLESLQIGPKSGDSADFAEWRNDGCVAFWQEMRQLQLAHPGRLALLGSGRYRHRDFGAGMPFMRLPDDALWRMLLWFPNLRRLSETSRAGLVSRLAGHPRAVDFLEELIRQALLEWEYDNGPFETGCLSEAEEQTQIIDAVLPGLDARLSEDLLFEALWERVLEAPARDLLVRAGVLRRPAAREVIAVLADDDGKKAMEQLRTTCLLSEIRERRPDGKLVSRFEVHPMIARLAEQRSERATELCRDGHRRAGEYYAQQAAISPDWGDNIEAAYHVRQVGELDRAFDLVAPLISGLQQRGRNQEALHFLAEGSDPQVLHPGRLAWVHTFLGDASRAYGDLPRALDAFRASLTIRESLTRADPGNAGWQRDLSVSYEKTGNVQVAQGKLGEALQAYRAGLAIAERLAKSDPGNAEWQRDLAINNERLGDIYLRQGKHKEARQSFERALEVYMSLIARNPDDVQSEVSSVVPRWWLASLDPLKGPDHLKAALAILKSLAKANRLDANRLGWISQIESQLAALEK